MGDFNGWIYYYYDVKYYWYNYCFFGVKATANMIHGFVLAECRAECFLRAFFSQTNRLGFFVCVCVELMFIQLIGLLISGKCFAASL